MLLGFNSRGRHESLRGDQFSFHEFERWRRQHERRETVNYLAREIFVWTNCSRIVRFLMRSTQRIFRKGRTSEITTIVMPSLE